MPPRQISIHQYHQGTRVGDGTTNTMLLVQQLLTKLGFKSEVFADGIDPALSARIRHLNELRPGPDDILLIHHGWHQDHFDRLAALPCRRVLVYHSITPPRFYDRQSIDLRYSLDSFQQLLRFRDIVECSIALSTYNARQLRQRGFANIAVIPFHKDFVGVRYAPHRKAPYYDQSAVFRILYVGRVAPHKRQRDLVQFIGAARSIRDFPLELVLVGHAEHGEDYSVEIRKEIQRLGVANQVVMTGSIPDDELLGHYRAANAYLSLSEHEGFGIPLIEAMALDLPVIAYAAAGIAETMGDAGILIRDKEPATILGHLLRLHDDRSFRGNVIRRQRERVLWYGLDHIVRALRSWLVCLNAYQTQSPGSDASDNRDGEWSGNFDAEPAKVPLPSGNVRYVIEGPFETSYSLANSNRQMAVALDRLPKRVAHIEPAEGVEDYRVNREAASRLPAAIRKLVRPAPVTAERVVTIRHMYPPRPNGMLGDVRLVHLPWEESAISRSLAELMNLHLDGVLVASEFVKRAVRNSGVRLPIAVIGHGIDHALPPEAKADRRARRGPVSAAAPFTFLHISSGLPRKGIEELVTAYCVAFTSHDPVLLVIKTFDHEQNVVDSSLKQAAGGDFAPAIQVIAEELDQQQMEFLYGTADAVVLPTRGEAFNFPAAEAMVRAIPVIVTGHGGHLDYCDAENAVLVDYAFEFSTSHLNVPDSLWARASLPHLVEAMKLVYRDGRAPGTPIALSAQRGQHAASSLRWRDVAERVDDFVAHLDGRPMMTRKLRLAWVSTYNARCGIAAYSENLLEFLDPAVFDITILANDEHPVRGDSPNVRRLWTDRTGSLERVRDHLLANNFDAVLFQFNFGFFDIHDFAKTLAALHGAGIDTFLIMHKTSDAFIDGRSVSLEEIAPTLKDCTRVFVHGVDDINRLKSMGIVDNVVLMKHGVRDRPPLEAAAVRSLLGLQRFGPVIGTFGFLVPPKGFQAIIHGFALVLRHSPGALLLMVCSDYPVAESAEERERCFAMIKNLGIEDNVRLVNDFLDDEEEAVFLLSACDAIVYGYQHSSESASGAIRIGLAAGRPIGTTPLRIFSELSALVHQFRGTGPADIADGIRALLDRSYPTEEILRKQREWLQTNSWSTQAARLGNIIRGCVADRHCVDFRVPAPAVPSLSAGDGQDRASKRDGGNALRELIEAEFLALSNRDFLSLAFRRTLSRDPTPEEMRHYEAGDADSWSAAGRRRMMLEIAELAGTQGNGANPRPAILVSAASSNGAAPPLAIGGEADATGGGPRDWPRQ